MDVTYADRSAHFADRLAGELTNPRDGAARWCSIVLRGQLHDVEPTTSSAALHTALHREAGTEIFAPSERSSPVTVPPPIKHTYEGETIMLLISVQPGEEVMESLNRQLAEHGVVDGAIASLIGAVDACGISNVAKNDCRNDIVTELEQPLEFSGTGEIKVGKLHIHCVISGEGNTALGAHRA